MVCMYCLGDLRSVIFSPRASRARSRWRIFSRSVATAFMRRDSESVARSGIAKVKTVATAAMAANTIAIIWGLFTCAMRKSTMAPASEIEIDHFAHHHHAHAHPEAASRQHHASGRVGPEQLDVVGAADVDEHHHCDRQARDDRSRGFRHHR